MSESDIISTTLDQLLDKFNSSPELFWRDNSNYTDMIVWHTPVNSRQSVNDPVIYSRTIAISWSNYEKTISARIYSSAHNSAITLPCEEPIAYLESSRFLEQYRSNYRKFLKLKKLIIKYNNQEKTRDFLSKLSSIFPAMLDRFILGE